MVGRIVVAIVLAFAGTVSPVVAQQTQVRMFDGLPLVPVSINHAAPRWFIVDTGTTTTTLSERLAHELGLTPTATADIETAGGSTLALVGAARSVTVGTVELGGGAVTWQRLDNVSAPRDVDGVLGFDRLSRVSFLLDYRRKTLEFDLRGQLAESVNGERTPFVRSVGRPVVNTIVRVGNAPEESRRLVVDTGAATTVLIERTSDPSGSRLLLTTAGSTRAKSAEVSVRVGRMTLLRTAAVIVSPKAQMLREDDGLLPVSMFAWLYFDVNRGEIVWQR